MAENCCQKFYLAKNVSVRLFPTMLGRLEPHPARYTLAAFSFLKCLNRVAITAGHENPSLEERQLCDKLTAVFGNKPMNWSVSLQVQGNSALGSAQPHFHVDTEIRVNFESPVDFVTGLHAVLGRDVRFQAHIYGLTCASGFPIQNQEIRTKKMTMARSDDFKVLCVDFSNNHELNEMLTQVMLSNQALIPAVEVNMKGKMDLIILVDGEVPETRFLAGPSTEQKMVVNKQMLENELATDVVIVCSNGEEVKCHRSFLMAHSPVFQAMFQTDMQEANTRKVEWPDVHEYIAQAFLAYLYHWDVSKAEENCGVALELLKAGHKYGISLLENDMRRLFLSKPDTWFEMDVALKLFLFVHNFDAVWDELKMKIVKALKKYAPTLQSSPTYQELVRQNPEAAMELVQYSLLI